MKSNTFFDYYKSQVNQELQHFFKKKKKEINFSNKNFFSFIEKYIFSGGKRLRPLAFIFSYSQFKKFEKKVLLPGIAIELHHTYTLILDDIMDEDELRRNNPTVFKNLKDYYLKNFNDDKYYGPLFNKKSSRFAVSFAIMLGNLTNILSKEAILNSKFSDEIKLKAINILEKTDKEIYQGQMLDILFENIPYKEATEEKYIEMIKLKTGVLFGASFEFGALFSNNFRLMNYLKEIGINYAIAFQINDDILDLSIDRKKGHELGSDLKKQKKTLILLKALEHLNKKKEYGKIKFLLGINQKSSEDEIKKAIQIINDTGSIIYATKKKQFYFEESQKDLKRLKLDTLLNFLNLISNKI